jgi:hypothetical protein
LLLAVALPALSLRTQADGGLVQLHQTAGQFVVTVFAEPTPPRVGPVDVSVLAQDRADGRVSPDLEVFVRLRSERGAIVVGRASRAASRNNLFYSASMNLPEAGKWELEVTVRGNKPGERGASVLGQLSVAEARPFLLSNWRSLSLPWIAITLFSLNQWLKRRSSGQGTRDRVSSHPMRPGA